MTLADKIASLPTAMKMVDKAHGKEGWGGLCIRYVYSMGKWCCGYGKSRRNKTSIFGDKPEEAVDNFIVFLAEHAKKKK